MGLIVGRQILQRELLRNAKEHNLKNSSYDLCVGKIVPVGHTGGPISTDDPEHYMLQPQEMVLVLSHEEFALPATVTGVATLRTSLTKDGILALNVGIIDPFYKGPISASLINFSSKAKGIKRGDKFFRVIFFEHGDVTDYRPTIDESTNKDIYLRSMREAGASTFPKSYLNTALDHKQFYVDNFWKLLGFGLFGNWLGRLVFIVLLLFLYYAIFGSNFLPFLKASLLWIRDNVALIGG